MTTNTIAMQLQQVGDYYLQFGLNEFEINEFFKSVNHNPKIANTDAAINDWVARYCNANQQILSGITTIKKYVVDNPSIWKIWTLIRKNNELLTEFNIKKWAGKLGFQLLPEQVVVTNHLVYDTVVYDTVSPVILYETYY